MNELSYHERIALAVQWLDEAIHFVAFTGAGISTDSGLPDFRGPDGVWTRRDKGLPPPRWKVSPADIRPNAGHYALVELYERKRLAFLISQNVDNLHISSGIPPSAIAELHGNGSRYKCLDCDHRYSAQEIAWDEKRWGKGYRTQPVRVGQPSCPHCTGRLISSVVNFGDPMPTREMELATAHSSKSDLFFAIGSSLVVSPANEFPRLAVDNGARLVIINRGETPLDGLADLRFTEGIGEVLPQLVQKLIRRRETELPSA